jgi:hypothetical protein
MLSDGGVRGDEFYGVLAENLVADANQAAQDEFPLGFRAIDRDMRCDQESRVKGQPVTPFRDP